MVKRAYIVRHGETDYNLTGRWQGHLDVSLNEQGRQQAKALARLLDTFQVDAVYSSDLIRAYETAQLLTAHRGLDIVKDARLREINLGNFQGLTREEIRRTYPLEYDRWHNDDSYVVPQGESRLQLQARVVKAWQEITAIAAGDNILLVAHGGTIRWLLAFLFTPEQTAGRAINNTSLTTLELDETSWKLAEYAATLHLSE
jgi:broad specificity phosphatase PhoE